MCRKEGSTSIDVSEVFESTVGDRETVDWRSSSTEFVKQNLINEDMSIVSGLTVREETDERPACCTFENARSFVHFDHEGTSIPIKFVSSSDTTVYLVEYTDTSRASGDIRSCLCENRDESGLSQVSTLSRHVLIYEIDSDQDDVRRTGEDSLVQ